MKKIWRPVRLIKLRDLASILILVKFDDITDKDQVIREGPWSFYKKLVMIKEVDENQQVH